MVLRTTNNRRDFKKYSRESFTSDLKSETWDDVISCQDVNLAYNRFLTKFQNFASKHAPFKTIRNINKKKDKSWITHGIKKSIKAKHKMYAKLIKGGFKEPLYTRYKKIQEYFDKYS